jgi:hypothetical protein
MLLEALPSAGEPDVCKPILEMHDPADTSFGRSLSTSDLGLGLRDALPTSGVDGDSVPIRDFRAADRGVIFPPKVDVDCPSSVRLLVTDSLCRARFAGTFGDALLDPNTLGVKGLLVWRKAELRLGVRGLAELPLLCLSMGMLCVKGLPAT